ncbi:hypothetical protein MG293_018648 [Ovis ammon polii]|uniref:Uncharacterized protein n=1 Tax=Ovis ammon polii TaxID=230172 RepID=A0AAD4TR04_OVIAM|nr:hypothetical protein MG293_018648 [Ovis ammon polii]
MLTAGLPLDRFRLDFILYKQAQRSEANFPKCHSRKVAETGCEIKNTLSTYLDFSLLKGPCKNYGGNSDSYNGDDGSNTFSEEMSFLLDNIAHNGGFKPNYPLLFPKFTIKLSIKTGSDSSSSPSTEAAELHQNPSVSRQEKGTQADRQQTDGQTHPPPVTPGSSVRYFSLSPETGCNQGCERKSSHHQWHLVLACHGNKPIAHFGSCTNNSLRTQSILHKKRYQKQTQCGGLTPMAPEVKMLVPCTAH